MTSKRIACGAIITMLTLSACVIDRGRDRDQRPYGHNSDLGRDSEQQDGFRDRRDQHCDDSYGRNKRDCDARMH